MMKEQLPKAEFEGTLNIADISFACAVLDDGRRVISEAEFMAGMGMYRSGALSTRRKPKEGTEAGAPIPLFLAHKNLQPFVLLHFGAVHYVPIRYVAKGGNIGHGIEATTLPKVCEVWIDAERAGVLGASQEKVAAKADILLRGFAHVGVIALVDAATGFEKFRSKEALEEFLKDYLNDKATKWVKTFPDEFFEAIFKMRGWTWGQMGKKPGVVGKYINNLVYDRLGPEILAELRKLNPKQEDGTRKHKHHQFLTDDIGNPALRQHLQTLVAFAKGTGHHWGNFLRLVERAFPKGGQTRLELPE